MNERLMAFGDSLLVAHHKFLRSDSAGVQQWTPRRSASSRYELPR
jgi:hypothetical protein